MIASSNFGTENQVYHLLIKHPERGWTIAYDLAFKTACALTKNKNYAEELTQKAITSAFKSFSTYDPNRKFSSWLATIVVNKFKDDLRDQKRSRIKCSHSSLVNEEVSSKSFTDYLKGGISEPIVQKIRQEEKSRLEKIIRDLGDLGNEIIELMYLRGLTIPEIATYTQIPQGTVKSRLETALTKLRANPKIREVYRDY